jgi:hypothetical protein
MRYDPLRLVDMSRSKRAVRLALLLGLAPLGGCSAMGGAAGGLTGIIGSVFQLALYLAAVAAPLALSYYFYKQGQDDD